MAQKRESNWGQLLKACRKIGKDNVIKRLEAYHKTLENMEAHLWSEPEMHGKASKLRSMLLKQDETLIRLQQMSDNDIRISMETGKVGIHI